jgi:hypothetical protein
VPAQIFLDRTVHKLLERHFPVQRLAPHALEVPDGKEIEGLLKTA